jgi:hypothetical protein
MLTKKVEYVFNKVALNLIKEIKVKDGDIKKKLKENYVVFDKKSESHIAHFKDAILVNDSKPLFTKTYENDILGNESIKTLEILKGITVNDIINVVDVSETEAVKCYLYTFYLLSYLHNECESLGEEDVDGLESMGLLFKKCLKIISNSNEDDTSTDFDEIIDDELKILVENIYATRKHTNDALIKRTELENFETVETMGMEDSDIFSFLNNSKIGELAKEISKDIDLSKINIDKPEDLLNIDAIFSGQNNMIGDIIGNVGKKIAGKIETGELKQDDLIQEAMSMMSKMNGGGSFMETMMKQASSGGFGNNTSTGGTEENTNSPAYRKNKRRDMLRRRLEERRGNSQSDHI